MDEVGSGGESSNSRVVTLETFIIDTFTRVDKDGIEHCVDQEDQIGGGGTYAILGSRIFLPANRLGMIVDYTPSTLPSQMKAQLEEYGPEMWCFRERDDGNPTTRSVNRYTGNLRVFEYLNKPRYLSPIDLASTPWDLPAVIHIISEVSRLTKFWPEIKELERRRGKAWRPKVVWEPEPYDCVPERLEAVREFARGVDIFSPNHTEALSLLSITKPPNIRSALTEACTEFSSWGMSMGVVIRAGSLGCCYIKVGETEVNWIPAFWSGEGSASKVVDPTGAGNAFCGAMSSAVAEGHDLREAVLWGTVAASFMIEQNGLPRMSKQSERELWNGEDPWERLMSLKRRLRVER